MTFKVAGGERGARGGAEGLRARILVLAAANSACYAVLTIASFGLVGTLPEGGQVHEQAFLEQLAQRASVLGPSVQSYIRGSRPPSMLVTYVLPQVVPAASLIVLLFLLSRYRAHISARTVSLLIGCAALFGLASSLAMPIIAQDFWLSAGWGRMVALGGNPYHDLLTPEMTVGLPLDMFDTKMPYGPAWSFLCGILSRVAGSSAVRLGILFKLVLASAWFGCLFAIRDLLREETPWRQAIGVSLWGWMPSALHQTVAEGHNDVMMVLFLLLCFCALSRQRSELAGLALTVSAMMKYVTAPLFLLLLLHERRARGKRWGAALLSVVPGALLGAVCVAWFFRSREALVNAWNTTGWRFFTPSRAIDDALRLAGVDVVYFAAPVRIGFVVVAVYFLVKYWRSPTPSALYLAATAALVGLLNGAVGHVWPWFLVWPLGVAALVPGSVMSRWVVGLSLSAGVALPVCAILFTGPGVTEQWEIPGIVFQGLALLWLILVPSTWLGEARTAARTRPS